MKETSLDGASADVANQNIQQLKQLFPEAFCEDRIDFDKLRALLGESVDDNPERYNFTWWGKTRAMRLAQSPSMGTLRPCKEESKDWDSTQNLYIEGDNLEVLKLLQKSYHSKVKLIYIDPPYNTGNDFVYPDDYKDNLKNYLEMTAQVDGSGKKLGTNSEAGGRYHTNWLNMIYPRLRLARNLLREDGVIFISIDDNEVANLRKVCDEVFGEENFVANVVWEKKYSPSNDAKWFSDNHDHILIYARHKESWRPNLIKRTAEQLERYKNPDNDPRGLWKSSGMDVKTYSSTYDFPITVPSGRVVNPPAGSCWRFSKDKYCEMVEDNRIWFGPDGNNVPSIKRFLSEVKDGVTPLTIWKYKEVGHTQLATQEVKKIFGTSAYFETPKPTPLLKKIILLSSGENDIILDFFSGSSTTAHAVMQLNAEDGGQRRYIMVQLPEPTPPDSEARKAGYANICEIGKERIRRAGEKIKTELKAKQPSLLEGEQIADPETLDIGFKVFKLDSSNLKKWQPDADALEASLHLAIDNFLPDRSALDVVYEVLLKYGAALSLPLETYPVDGKHIYAVDDGTLMICLDNDITTAVAEEMLRLKQQLQPEVMRVVFKDNGFNDDSAKTNVREILRNGGVDEIVSV